MRSRKSATKRAPSRVREAKAADVGARWAVPIVLGVTFLVYLPTLWFPFIYDDLEDIVGNQGIQSWDAVPRYFFPQGGQILGSTGWHADRFYRPLFLLWLRLNHAFFGLQPGYWHLAAVASHLLVTWLVYRLALRLAGDWLPATLAGLLFGLHPVHAQVVSWCSVVSESLVCAALLASLLCYAAREQGKARYAGSLMLFATALLLKETAIVFPGMIFAYSLLFAPPEQGWLRRVGMAMREALPFLGLSVGYLAMRFAAMNKIIVAVSQATDGSTLLTIPSVLIFYAKLLLWPVGLSPLYTTPFVKRADVWNFALPLLLLMMMIVAVVWPLWRLRAVEAGDPHPRWRLALFSCAWVVFLLPALNLPAFPEEEIVQDRYVYLPSVGFAILLALGLERLGRLKHRQQGVPAATLVPALVLVAAMAAVTVEESHIWTSGEALFPRAVEKAPRSKIARANFAIVLLNSQRLDEAIALMKKLLEEYPTDYVVRHNLIQAYLRKGDLPDAEEQLSASCRTYPTAPDLYQLGVVRLNLHHPESAEAPLRQAIDLDPKASGYHLAYGVVLYQLGNWQRAEEEYRRELEVNPMNDQARQALAQIEQANSSTR